MLAAEGPGIARTSLVSISVWVKRNSSHVKEVGVGEGGGERVFDRGSAAWALRLIEELDLNFVGGLDVGDNSIGFNLEEQILGGSYGYHR